MEEISTRSSRIFRSREEILQLLSKQSDSGLSVRQFCQEHAITEGSFHYWKRRYNKAEVRDAKSAFTRIDVSAGVSVLFAQVGGIKIYQPVSADYLKELAL